MKYRIIRIDISGMKGIEKQISFQFQNETIDYIKANKSSSIKAIYGMNGSGKTSFITAVDIYKSINSSFSFLNDDKIVKHLSDLVNKKSHKFVIKVYFMVIEKKVTYCHELELNCKTAKPYIEKEKLSIITGKTINGEELVVFETSNDQLKVFHESDNMDILGFLKQKLEKKNEYCSAIALFSDANFLKDLIGFIEKESSGFQKDSVIVSLVFVLDFVRNINVFINNEDRRNEYLSLIQLKSIIDRFIENADDTIVVGRETLIEKTKFKDYKMQISQAEKFVKLFKPDLKGIEISKRVNKQFYCCRLIMNYDSYKIDYEYESAGIKNLISMFSCLKQASNGSIAFIDELDANINEIILGKLCDYFSEYGKGQLCFTTHNTAPMKILKDKSYGIDFIGVNQELFKWAKNGNYSPIAAYTDGMIPGLPFNIESFDFIGVFSPEE